VDTEMVRAESGVGPQLTSNHSDVSPACRLIPSPVPETNRPLSETVISASATGWQ